MSNKRITDLTELTNPTTDDVFPVVDIATNTTTKVQLGNLPVPTSVTTALATKENTITPGTTAQYYRGDKSFQTLDKTAVGLGNVDNTSDANKPVSTATQTALNAKQDTLVSGTNIKTINSTSLLGSGNIDVVTSPSGSAGYIQFSNGSAFASDANLFWDNTNKRLGIGTTSPTSKLQVNGSGDQLWLTNNSDIYTYLKLSAAGGFVGLTFGDGGGGVNYINNYSNGAWASNKFAFGSSYFAPSGQVHIKGSGSTSATTSLLVQNSSGTDLLKVTDNGQLNIGGSVSRINSDSNDLLLTSSNMRFAGVANFGLGNYTSLSAVLQADSTTKGFLPPRMTTTQKNAISSPASGLVVYDTTTNKLCCYNGTSWNDLF